MLKKSWNLALALSLCLGMPSYADNQSTVDLTQMRLEDLMDIKVTSVTKREQSLSRTAAAVFVITQEDIRRSGATNIPDLLRMASGVDVAQIDANSWAISIRGFNSRYSNKVLVLVDGRSVYTPSFSGVFWEHLDMPLANIDRIEVFRGPGASVWGANAVNGVISIFTKSSKETPGVLVSAGGGSHVAADGLVQYGGTIGSGGSFRGFTKYFDVNNSAMADGSTANDRWQRVHGGFRTDWDLSKRDSLMVQGDLFDNEESQTVWSSVVPTALDHKINQTFDAAGGDVLARWKHTSLGGSETSLQTYFDTYRRSDMGVPEVLKTIDIDFQDHISVGARQDIVWGGGFRVYNSKLAPGYAVGFSPPSETENLFSTFFQDEIRLANSFWFTAGIKVEHNGYTGVAAEPSARLVWAPTGSRQMIWATASKAVRQPSRTDTAVESTLQSVPLGPDTAAVLRLFGNPRIKNEESRDYELGYRSELMKNLSLDATAFLTFYHHLETLEPQAIQIVPGTPLQLLVPLLYDNKAQAVDYGGELSLNWNATSRWRLSPGYSYLHSTIRFDPSSQGQIEFGIPTGFPQHTFQIRSQLNLSRKLEFDQSMYYTARLPGGSIPGHARLDLRLARRMGESAEVSLSGQNLLRPRTTEYGDSYAVVGTQVVRSIYGRITWRF